MLRACLFFLLLNSVYANATSDDCPSAADAAEAQNPNLYKDCDYTKTGLNGVIHKAMAAKKEEAPNAEGVTELVSKSTNDSDKKISAKVVSTSKEFTSAEQLQQVRFNLIQQAIQACARGFVLEKESYFPVDAKRLKIELNYSCL